MEAGEVKHHIRKGDEVQLIRGSGSGRRTKPPEDDPKANPIGPRGRVRRVLEEEGRVVVDRVRLVSKATRPDPRKGVRGGFTKVEASIPLSSVMLVCGKCDRPRRVRFVKKEDGKKVRVCRACGEEM